MSKRAMWLGAPLLFLVPLLETLPRGWRFVVISFVSGAALGFALRPPIGPPARQSRAH